MSEELIQRLGSEDFNERAKALAALVGQGRAASPLLVKALDSDDDQLRVQAAQALSEIADPATAGALDAATRDEDPTVRGHAAAGLARIGDPRAIDALIRTIDDLPDPLHYPYTAAVYALEALGRQAVPAVLPLLDSEDPNTRSRALVVLRSVVPESEGWDAAQWTEWVNRPHP